MRLPGIIVVVGELASDPGVGVRLPGIIVVVGELAPDPGVSKTT